jgi:sentrin-specific protease 7
VKRQRLGKPLESISLKDFQTLEPGKWVNDEIMNTYLDYLIDALPNVQKRVYVFSTFFYKELNQDLRDGQIINYSKVQRWTKSNILKYEYVVVPIIEQLHWYFIIICRDGNDK